MLQIKNIGKTNFMNNFYKIDNIEDIYTNDNNIQICKNKYYVK